MKMGWKLFLILVGIFLISSVYAVSDTAVFQGQYYDGTVFHQGTYEFNFDIYTGEIFGDLVYSNTQNLTTGVWGEWRVELDGISATCNDTTKDYFIEITIDNSTQTPRRRLTHFNYLRKNVNEITTGDLTIGSVLNFVLGGYFQELANLIIISKGLQVQGNLNVTDTGYFDELESGRANVTEIFADEISASNELKLGGKSVCLEDGTNCAGGGGGSSGNYVSFISTINGDLRTSIRYLPLGTNELASATDDEPSWIIGRDMTITGILWHTDTNARTETSAITLMKSTTGKHAFVDTDLSVDIQGIEDGTNLNFNVSFSQEDLAVIKYEPSAGGTGAIHDLSVTLIGEYN